MGNFSYISKNRHEQILNPWHQETLCELQLVIDGKVVEKLRGVYSGYGAVDVEKEFQHLVLRDGVWIDITEETKAKDTSMDGDIWASHTWDEINDIHFDFGFDGIAAWHLSSMSEVVPEALTFSANDEHQGDLHNERYEYDEQDENW